MNYDEIHYPLGGGVELRYGNRVGQNLFEFGYVCHTVMGTKYLAPRLSLTHPEVLNLINIVSGPLSVLLPSLLDTPCSKSHLEASEKLRCVFCINNTVIVD